MLIWTNILADCDEPLPPNFGGNCYTKIFPYKLFTTIWKAYFLVFAKWKKLPQKIDTLAIVSINVKIKIALSKDEVRILIQILVGDLGPS